MTLEERNKQVEERRRLKGYRSQEDFAEAAGLPDRTYKSFLQGSNCRADTLIKIAKALDVSVDFVLGETDHLHVDDEDIHNQIGLSFEAISTLRRWQNPPTRGINIFKHSTPQWIKTLNALILNAGWDSVLEALYYYLRVFPSDFHLSIEEEVYEYDQNDPDKVIGADFVTKWIGHYCENEVSITLDNGTGFLLNEDFLASAQLTIVTKSIQDLREKLWKKWKKERSTKEK